ncbi:hypothetical protein [Pseudanabaena sp. FACHB-2040]|uniref:hypothetical protein n=1 Tax=Pseudanabaena sp. FACHB-2040 TaxID=2692859 RepID=UPI0016865679|nr:hypothetical protein [Pseudanabaena sp. FACHB-2040]
MGTLLCLSLVSVSGLAVQSNAAAALMLAQATPVASPRDCREERQIAQETLLNAAIDQAEQSLNSGQLDHAALLLVRTLQNIQAMENSPAKVNLLERLVGSVNENSAHTGILKRLVQTVPTEKPQPAIAVLAAAVETTQSLSSGYSASKTRTFLALADYYTGLGQPGQNRQALAEALSASMSIHGAEFQTMAFSAIAAAYIQVDQVETAVPLLAQALESTKAFPAEPYRQAVALEQIASLYAQTGQPDLALQALRMIPMPNHPSNAILSVVGGYGEAGQVDRALEVAQTIQPNTQKAVAQAVLAGRLTTQQPQQAARIYAQAVALATAGEDADSTLARVAQHYVEAGGLVVAAGGTIQTIKDPFVKAPALGAIALLHAKAGEEDHADLRLDQVLEALAAIPEDSNRNSVRQQLIDQAAQSGRYDYALRIAQTIQPGDEAPFERVNVLTLLAEQAIAQNRYDAALQLTEQIPPSFVSWRDRLFPQIASGFVQAGDFDRALAIAQQDNLSFSLRPRSLAAMAAQLAQLGQSEQAAALFNQATQFANEITDAYTRVEVLGAIAQAHLTAGQPEPATQLLNQAITAAQSIEDVSSRSLSLRTVAEQLIFANHYQAALQVAQAIPEALEQLHKLNDVIEKALAAGDLATVLTVLDQLEDPAVKTRWLVAAADRHIYLGRPEAAADVLNQAFQTTRTIPGEESQTVVIRSGEDPLSFDDNADRGSFLGAIALRYTQIGQRSEAEQVVQALESSALRQQVIQEMNCYR